MIDLHFYMPPYMPTRTLTTPSFTFCGEEVSGKGTVVKPWHWDKAAGSEREGHAICSECKQHWLRHKAVAREEEPSSHCVCHFCRNPPTI